MSPINPAAPNPVCLDVGVTADGAAAAFDVPEAVEVEAMTTATDAAMIPETMNAFIVDCCRRRHLLNTIWRDSSKTYITDLELCLQVNRNL
jgi:hypothetical protein